MTTQSILPVGGIAGAWRGEIRDTSRLDALLNHLQRRWDVYKTYRRTVEELELLSDRELNDVGISRYDIRGIARQSAEMEVASRG
jgi:uncharacterized protein YjiS (DUF1127 family)